ncbi:MAG TPA: hypothetical protein ENO38_04060 [Nitrososphaeria archaeon]|nr:hypothetical protein [Conexivisphaerales archaeon]HEU16827.1 hypothetical protein [Nitrososphaeria archaeon]
MSKCTMCTHYIPHPQYRYIGYCAETGSVVLGDRTQCDKFAPTAEDQLRAALELRGWIYCADCHRTIFDLDEALAHARGGDLLSSRFMFDEVAREEVSTAD